MTQNANNVQEMHNICIICIDRPKKKLKGKTALRPRVTARVKSTQIKSSSGQSGWEAAWRERWPKAPKTNLSSRGTVRLKLDQMVHVMARREVGPR